MKDIPAFVDAFAWFQADSYGGILRAVLVGCVLTILVQSSSATLAITIGLAATGVIPFTTAAALVLGENIGTTITIVLASIGGTVNAKRAAWAHVLFNLFGALWIVLLFPLYIQFVAGVVQTVHGADPIALTLVEAGPVQFAAVITAGIALSHTLFNVTNTLIFLPFLGPYTRLLRRIVPDPKFKEVPHLKHLDARAVSAPVLGVEQSRGEVIQMGQGVTKMVDWIRQLAFNGPMDERLVSKVFHREDVLDNMQQEVVTFLTEVMDANVPHAIAEEGRQQLRIAHEYESMADRLASVLKGYLKLRDLKLELSAQQREDLEDLHSSVAEFLHAVVAAYEARKTLADADAQSMSTTITRKVKRLRDEHLERVTAEPIDPRLSLIYTTLLTDYRRVRAHTTNVHEAMVSVHAVSE